MIIVFFSILLFLKIYHSFKGNNNLSSFLILLYLLTFICSLLYNFFEPQNEIDFVPSVFLITILLFWLLPYRNIDRTSIKHLNYNRYKFNRLVNVINFVGFFSTTFFIYSSLSILNIADASNARQIASEWGMLSPGPVTTFFIIYTTIFHVNLLFYFISVCRNDMKVKSYLLLYSSFSFPLMCLCFFGRDGLVYWFLNFLILFFLFKQSIPIKALKKIKYFFSVITLFLIFIFSFMSIARFGTVSNSENNLIEGTLGYLGQQYNNFSRSFYIEIDDQVLFHGFRSIFEKCGILEEVKNFDRKDFYLNQGASDVYSVFGYFVKTFIWGFGIIPTFIISILAYFFVKKKSIVYIKFKNIEDLIVLFSLFQIPLLGLFYFRQSVTRMDIGFLLIFVVYYYFKINRYGVK